ncbi:MAG: S4 domain-containing protein YaaA [Candidatus Izemoplasmatales bacterium]|nr:S4 domain-containing protein YaaA [Candidatus Izemoplasmatales bacterium]MDD3865489.1 S4 domain-containing protein YaaA [Candidatus Izemoplasmatales bacterium]
MKAIKITSEYITLGQLLKFADVIQSGGETKFFLSKNKIWVNHELEARRGKKLYPGDQIKINDEIMLEIVKQQ